MRPEVLYLTDIVDAAAAIARFLAGVEREAFLLFHPFICFTQPRVLLGGVR